MADKVKKRQRLSGSQYLKKKLAREADLIKQKDSLLKFITSNQLDTGSQNKNLNIEDQNMSIQKIKDRENSDDSEDNDEIENNENRVISIEDMNRNKNKYDSIDYGGNLNNEDMNMQYDNDDCDNHNDEITNFEFTDEPNKWPLIDDKLRLYLIQCEPNQICMKKYPINDDGRSFSTFHYFRRLPNGEHIKRTWIIYSKSSDSVFCFCCKLFNNGLGSLATNGNNDWKNISNILKRHEKSPIHKKSYEDWKELEARFKSGKTIDDINQSNIKIETEHWKNVLKRIIALIKTISSQNLALRGKSDKLYSHNNGNFLKFIEYLSMFDPIMKEHIRRISSEEIHCHYLGKDIQNEVIQLLANKIRSHILIALKNAKYYSIILDCTPDVSNKE